METWLLIFFIVILVLLIIFSAIFSAAEIAYSSLTKLTIEKNDKKNKKVTKLIKKHFQKFGTTLATILIANNIVNIASSSIVTILFSRLFDASIVATLVSTFVMTPIIVILGEITPKLLAKKNPFSYLLVVAYLIEFFSILFYPFTFFLQKATSSYKKTNSESDLHKLIKIALNEGVLEKEEASLAEKALDLDSVSVSKIMIPYEEIKFLDYNLISNINDCKKQFKILKHTRLPIKKDQMFIGWIFLKDILFEDDNELISKYIKPLTIISQNTSLSIALEKMRINKIHLSLVKHSQNNENIVGLLTIEDIVESLLGKIYDENEQVKNVREIANHKWIVINDILMNEIFKELNLSEYFDQFLDKSILNFLEEVTNKKIHKNLKYILEKKIIFKVIFFDEKTRNFKIKIIKK